MDFDFGTLSIAGVSLAILVYGITEFIKTFFGLEGKWVNLTAVISGGVLVLASELRQFLPPAYSTVLNVVVLVLAGAMSAGGYYQYVNKKLAQFAAFLAQNNNDGGHGTLG